MFVYELRCCGLWVRVPLQSLNLQILHLLQVKSSLTIKQLCQCHHATSLEPDSLVEELKHVHLQNCAWLNALKATLPSLNIKFCRWKSLYGIIMYSSYKAKLRIFQLILKACTISFNSLNYISIF